MLIKRLIIRVQNSKLTIKLTNTPKPMLDVQKLQFGVVSLPQTTSSSTIDHFSETLIVTHVIATLRLFCSLIVVHRHVLLIRITEFQ